MAVLLARQALVVRCASRGGARLSCCVLCEDKRDEEHGGCGVERCAGYVDSGANRFTEDKSEDARAEESGDAAEAVNGALELALFRGTRFVRHDALGGGPG